jgi:outer membrane protein OmpA-like peptidoglycan-associated protein
MADAQGIAFERDVMNGNRTRMLGLCLLAVVGFMSLTGCQNRLKTERDALYVQNQELQEELDRARAALSAGGDNSALLAELESLRAQLAAQPQPGAATGFEGIAGIEAYNTGATVTVRVPGDILFASGKIDLKDSAKSTLSQVAGVIRNEYAGNTVRVEGYTDTDPIRKSSWKDNLELSLQRAAAVHRHLQSQGISADNMYAAGFGQARQRETKEKSRRVEIVVVLRE